MFCVCVTRSYERSVSQPLGGEPVSPASSAASGASAAVDWEHIGPEDARAS